LSVHLSALTGATTPRRGRGCALVFGLSSIPFSRSASARGDTPLHVGDVRVSLRCPRPVGLEWIQSPGPAFGQQFKLPEADEPVNTDPTARLPRTGRVTIAQQRARSGPQAASTTP
jgi:hypothetical protein